MLLPPLLGMLLLLLFPWLLLLLLLLLLLWPWAAVAVAAEDLCGRDRCSGSLHHCSPLAILHVQSWDFSLLVQEGVNNFQQVALVNHGGQILVAAAAAAAAAAVAVPIKRLYASRAHQGDQRHW